MPTDKPGTPPEAGNMRYIRGVLRPVEKMHPVERSLAEHPELTPVAVHQLKLVDDGTCIVLLQVRGGTAPLDDLLSSHHSIVEYAIAGNQNAFVYLQSEPHDLSRYLLNLRDNAEIVVEMPLRHTDDGGLRGTVIGDERAFQRAIESLPPEIDIDIESIGDYHPDMRDLFSTLTGRQQEILGTAVSMGYYEAPRRASQGEIADRLGIARGTVGEHLRRIEAKVFSQYVPDSTDTRNE